MGKGGGAAERELRTVFEHAASAPATRGVGDDSDKHENDGGQWAVRQNDSRKLAGISRTTTSAAQVRVGIICWCP